MCVGLSAKVLSVDKDTALIDASGAKRTVSAQLISQLEPGDYVMVHAGMAIAKIAGPDESEAESLLKDIV